jgi:hypothetical protein
MAHEAAALRAEIERLRAALECADYLISLHEKIARRQVVRDLCEAQAAYRAALANTPSAGGET